MATGAGKTFTAATFVHRLLRHAQAKRILFLVDSKNFETEPNLYIMKKLIIALLFVTFYTCSSSDDDTSQDLFIGIWKITKDVDVEFNGTENIYNYTPCEQQSRYTFSADGEVTYIEYDDNQNGDCEERVNSFEHISGSWEKLSENHYKLANTYYYFDTDETETEIDIENNVTFPNSTTMRWRRNHEDELSDFPYEYMYLEFKRVE